MIVSNMARAGVIGAIALAIFSGTVDIILHAAKIPRLVLTLSPNRLVSRSSMILDGEVVM